jgi:hypothetical protein
MSDPTQIADLRELRQRAAEAQERHLNNAKSSLRRLGYDVVPRQRRVGRIVGYVLFAAIGALSVAALVGALGLVTMAARWLVGLW